MTRLFIALIIPEDIRKKIIALRDELWSSPGKVRWEPEEKIHLTLKFIGDVKDEIVEEISDSISFISDYEKFNCSITGFGFFFNRKVPKIFWCGLRAQSSLEEMVNRLDRHFVKFAVPAEERKFKGHITLLRIKQPVSQDQIERVINFKPEEISFTAGEAALIKSELLPSGSKYTVIKKFLMK